VLLSPVRGCGKTTLLSVIESLAARPQKTDAITPAAVYHLIDREHRTLLIDEVDNADLAQNGRLRAIYNSGHRYGGGVTLMQRGRPHKYSTFAPLALAAIGTLPLPLMHRAVVIPMARHDGRRPLRRYDGLDSALNAAYALLLRWTRDVELDADPELPPDLHNRLADNWRPLIAIADACGWGDRAREAAVEFARSHHDEDCQVLLLRDIRAVFDARIVDRLASAVLVADLHAIDDAMWSEWRGLRGGHQMHRLSQNDLAMLLAPFGIRPRTVWPLNRTASSKSAKGYYRSQFEAAWRAYCADDGTASQTSNVRHLRNV